jgi:hypothetical protein
LKKGKVYSFWENRFPHEAIVGFHYFVGKSRSIISVVIVFLKLTKGWMEKK